MRVRTAVAIVSGFVVVKAALILIVLIGRASYLETGHAGTLRWQPGAGLLAEWLAAVAAAGAAVTALYIAGRDRRERIAERRDHETVQARLVQLAVGSEADRPVVKVTVRNFGPLPVIDVVIVDALWSEHPEARWTLEETSWQARGLPPNSNHRPILKPVEGPDDTFDTVVEFPICFRRPSDGMPLVPVVAGTQGWQGQPHRYVQTDVSNVNAKIHFTTANGVRWETPTKGTGSGEPRRL